MGRRKNSSTKTTGYPQLTYCSWAHGGVSSAGDNNAICVRPEKVLSRKRQKDIKQYSKSTQSESSSCDLCEICSTIDFEGIFSQHAADISDHGMAVFVLDHLKPESIGSQCQCCALLASMAFGVEEPKIARRRSPRVHWHLRVFPITCLWGVRTAPDQDVSLFLSLVCEVDTDSYPFPTSGPIGVLEELDHNLLENSWRRGLLIPTTSRISKRSAHGVVCRAASIGANFDYSRVAQLLTECSKNHLECSNYSLGAFPVGARVINCGTREIVDLVPSMEYLALSYVWGNPTMSKALHVKNRTVCLHENAPQTIEDAIMVTQRLGYNFLWIDQFCIQQHNNTEKKEQIRQMASIYSYAIATMCATGEDSKCGLFGVSKPRIPQQEFKVQDMVMARCVWPEHHIREHLKTSKWTTRGWTYQEPLLSKNCLFFTPETVIQVCHTRTFGEAVAVEYNLSSCFTNRTVVLSPSLFLPRLPLCMSAILPRRQLAISQSVQQYQKRNFSYDNDALNAFMGILSTVDMKSYWGVPVLRIERAYFAKGYKPIQSDTTTGFVFGLLWITTSRQEKWHPNLHQQASDNFPSWSWISRRAILTDFLHHGGLLKSARIRTVQLTYRTELVLYNAKVEIEDRYGKNVHPNDFILPVSRFVPEHSRYLSITSVTAQWKLSPIRFGSRTTGMLQGPGFACLDLEEVSDPDIQPLLAKMKLAGPARIAFDQGYTVDASTDLTQYHGAPAREGMAVLMLISKLSGKFTGSYSYWLAIRQEMDGTYRREGMIECHLQEDEMYGSGYTPPNDSLTTFRLG